MVLKLIGNGAHIIVGGDKTSPFISHRLQLLRVEDKLAQTFLPFLITDERGEGDDRASVGFAEIFVKLRLSTGACDFSESHSLKTVGAGGL